MIDPAPPEITTAAPLLHHPPGHDRPVELAKLLFHVDDYGFDRPSNGYSLMALLGARSDSPQLIASIRDNPSIDKEIREKAALLLSIQEQDPRWFSWWRKDA